jgi:superfamily II DNA/RNA helicase
VSLNQRNFVLLRQFFSHSSLISTDALARGIDIPKVDVVISYDMCKNMKSYIHRVGRTARAGHEGTAVTLVTGNNVKTFKRMLEDVGKTDCEAIATQTDETYSLAFAEAIKSLQKALEFEKKNAQVSRGGTSNLLARLQQQVDSKLNKSEGHLPSAWKAENVNGGPSEAASGGGGGKKRKGKKRKAAAAK